MKLSTKHQNQQTVMLSKFDGGLNTSVMDEFVAENQLSEAINVEINNTTGQLTTVLGTKVFLDFSKVYKHIPFVRGYWDSINDILVFIDEEKNIYATNFTKSALVKCGGLAGNKTVVTTTWEDGTLIASGGKLQYGRPVSVANTTTGVVTMQYRVTALKDSPDVCNDVFIRSGRVIVFDEYDNLRYSGVGDEENWEQDTNDPSSSLFLQVGYKAGGKLVAACNASSDVLLVKDNGRCFRLTNEYPDWQMADVSSETYCYNASSICNMGNNSTLVLGSGVLQMISPTQDYGDMKPQAFGNQVDRQIKNLPSCTRLVYLAKLNQIWFLYESQYVLVLDLNCNAFFQRFFNSKIVDVFQWDNEIVILKEHTIALLDDDESKMEDNGQPLPVRARFKTDVGLNDVLIKKVTASLTPKTNYYTEAQGTLGIGRIKLNFPLRDASDGIRKQTIGTTQNALEPASPFINGSDGEEHYISISEDNITAGKSILVKSRQICRADRIRVTLTSNGFPFSLNWITYDKVEV